jgi:adenylate cyclase
VAPEEPLRRLAAILSADVAGYSRLMAEDEEATVRMLRAWREQVGALVTEHRGRLADFTGDNFLASFGAARDAVECAVAIQRVVAARNAALPEARRMRFRIGAHLGDVRVEDGRLFGDGVNIAARLQPLAEPGGLCLSAALVEQVRGKLPLVYEDLGEQALKNIPNPVRAFRVRIEDSAPKATRTPSPPPRSRMRRPVLIAVAVLALAGLGVWAAWPRLLGVAFDASGILPGEHPPLPDKPSIAVLPFANMSGDPEQEYFAEGITEDLTTALSRTSSLFVISRNSAFTYKGKTFKIEDVGRELGVRYVVEGSVRRAGERVRVTAQLIEAASGFHVWSERYDRGLEDIFAVQSEITEQILGAVGATISAAELERIRRKPTESLTAYDAWAQGLQHFRRPSRNDLAEARRLYERAVQLDPDYANAVTGLGATYTASYQRFFTLDGTALDRAAELHARALELDPGLPIALVGRGVVDLARGNQEQARVWLERARELAPNDAVTHVFLGQTYLMAGDPGAALEELQQSLRLNPQISSSFQWLRLSADIRARTGRMDEAEALWEQARAEYPEWITGLLSLAARYEATGRHEQARAVLGEALRVNPELSVEALRHHSDIVARTPDLEAFLAQLRAAGLP